MRDWTNDERMMIACCNDGTRPVIFKIERFDYLAVKITGMACGNCAQKVQGALEAVDGVERAEVRLEKGWAEVFPKAGAQVSEAALKAAVEQSGYSVSGVE